MVNLRDSESCFKADAGQKRGFTEGLPTCELQFIHSIGKYQNRLRIRLRAVGGGGSLRIWNKQDRHPPLRNLQS